MDYFLKVLDEIEDRNSSGRFPVELFWDPAANVELSLSQVLCKLVEFVKPTKPQDEKDSSSAVDEQVSAPSGEDQQELDAAVV